MSMKGSPPPILLLEGSPYEIGYRHGSLLQEKIHRNIENHLTKPSFSEEAKKRIAAFLPEVPRLLSYVAPEYREEMEGVADGANVPVSDIIRLNLFPEAFHCCAVTVKGKAGKDQSLYHARLLDYGIGKGLESSAAICLIKSPGKIPFFSVTYAGFIGCITGMNTKKISLGEIGGGGYGRWNGIPMPFLLRTILESASSSEEAKKILLTSPRTCEYYYIVGDGNTQESFGCYATPETLRFLAPGTDYSISPPLNPEEDCRIETESPLKSSSGFFFSQPEDTLLLTGIIAPERYPILRERILEQYGSIDEIRLREIIKKPVAKTSNLHNAIFHPSSLRVWVSHAGPSGPELEPACDQPYRGYQISESGINALG